MIFKAILQYCQTRGEGKNGGGEEAVCTEKKNGKESKSSQCQFGFTGSLDVKCGSCRRVLWNC